MTDYLVTARARVSASTEQDAARLAREHIARDEIHVRVDEDVPNGARSGVNLPAMPDTRASEARGAHGTCATEGCERREAWLSIAEGPLHPDQVRRCRVCCNAIGEAFERLTETATRRDNLATRLGPIIRTLAPADVETLAGVLSNVRNGQAVSVAWDGGLKVKIGAGGWSPPFGDQRP